MIAVVHEMDDRVGEFRLDGDTIVLDPPDSPLLARILSEPLYVGRRHGGLISAEDNKELWLKSLPLQYRSPYLWVAVDEKPVAKPAVKGLISRLKGRGQPCKPGETAARDGCIPHVRHPKPRKPAANSENREGGFTEEGPYSEHTNKRVQTNAMIARGVAHELGFPQNKVHVNAGEPFKFELNGETHESAAHYDQKTREIVFEGQQLNDPLLSNVQIKGMAAHEIWHAIFHTVTERYMEERTALHTDKVMIPERTIPVTPQIAAKYPTYAAMFEVMEGMGGKIIEKLAALDGVSPYSAEYWHGVYNHTVGIQTAVTETLSEIARLENEAGPMPDEAKVSHKVWIDLRDAMMKEYNRLTGRQT